MVLIKIYLQQNWYRQRFTLSSFEIKQNRYRKTSIYIWNDLWPPFSTIFINNISRWLYERFVRICPHFHAQKIPKLRWSKGYPLWFVINRGFIWKNTIRKKEDFQNPWHQFWAIKNKDISLDHFAKEFVNFPLRFTEIVSK